MKNAATCRTPAGSGISGPDPPEKAPAKFLQAEPNPDQAGPRKWAWILLDSFVRFGAFQEVTGSPNQKSKTRLPRWNFAGGRRPDILRRPSPEEWAPRDEVRGRRTAPAWSALGVTGDSHWPFHRESKTAGRGLADRRARRGAISGRESSLSKDLRRHFRSTRVRPVPRRPLADRPASPRVERERRPYGDGSAVADNSPPSRFPRPGRPRRDPRGLA